MQGDKTQYHFQCVYAPYVSSLIAFCELKEGSSVLDVGCGQGFFSYLFRKYGMTVHAIDTSETRIRMAEHLYGHLGIAFTVGDIHTATFSERFDCVFVRSCSLYNNDAFSLHDEVTSRLMRHLKANGVFIFAYNSNFSSKKSSTWRYHSLKDVRRHFSRYPNANIFFSSKIDTWLLRKYAFTAFATRLNILLSRVSGLGGDLVCIFRNALVTSSQ